MEFVEDSTVELYNLANDPSESRELSKMEPELSMDLQIELSDWREAVHAFMPQQNEAYDPEKLKERYGLQYKPDWDPRNPPLPRP